MIKLLIADDETLVCVGLQSMIKWEQYNIEIVGTAQNGAQLEEMIESLRPDIVISDIKMPVKTGLEVAENVRKKYGRLPLFIILTSYEEFQYARAAIEVQAADYLVKLELTPQALTDSIIKTIARLEEYRELENAPSLDYRSNLNAQRDKFFIRLFNNLFENRSQFLLHKDDLSIELNEPAYAVSICRIEEPESVPPRGDKLVALCTSTLEMAKSTLQTDRPCFVTSLDLRNFAITLPLPTTDPQLWAPDVKRLLENMAVILSNYFNVTIMGSVGYAVKDPYLIRDSFQVARQMLPQAVKQESFLFHTNNKPAYENTIFDFSAMGSQMRRAFEEIDTRALHSVITSMIETFQGRQDALVPAIDAACNVLFMATAMLANGKDMVEQIFEDEPEGYRSIYQMHAIGEVIDWLTKFRDGCCDFLSSHTQSYKTQIVNNVQEYIKRNLNVKLTLNHVADVFNFSPNYLSTLFSKVAGVNFVEYITETKIAAAKEMMMRGEGRVYEISQKLGYDSAFYFSKVFKKVEGISPREFLQRLESEATARRA